MKRNSYDEKYEFRIANKDDIDAIMQFIRQNWRSDHLMAQNRQFFEYEFLEDNGAVNFVLAVNREKRTIECLNGFLKASHDTDCLDIWGSFWKVLNGNQGMLGVELIRRRKELVGCRCDMDVGDNPRTAIPVLKVLLKRYTAKMKHYYMLADRSDYKIAKVEYIPQMRVGDKRYEVEQFCNIEELQKGFDTALYKGSIPYKDGWYINHRFFEHPIYHYEVYGIREGDHIGAIFIIRRQAHGGRAAVRMVDYIGNRALIAGIGDFLKNYLMSGKESEYIDFYCDGLEEKHVLDAGFVVLQEDDKNIIPNYFEPFVQENIDIWVDSSEQNTLFTKADADQDRPNIIMRHTR